MSFLEKFLRNMYGIPEQFTFLATLDQKKVIFSFCDQDYVITLDGLCRRSWMALDVYSGHYFAEEIVPPKGISNGC